MLKQPALSDIFPLDSGIDLEILAEALAGEDPQIFAGATGQMTAEQPLRFALTKINTYTFLAEYTQRVTLVMERYARLSGKFVFWVLPKIHFMTTDAVLVSTALEVKPLLQEAAFQENLTMRIDSSAKVFIGEYGPISPWSSDALLARLRELLSILHRQNGSISSLTAYYQFASEQVFTLRVSFVGEQLMSVESDEI